MTMDFDIPQERVLYHRNDAMNTDKIYLIMMFQQRNDPGTWIVRSSWGRRSNWGPHQSQVKVCAGQYAAEKTFAQLVSAKLKKGYILADRDILPGGYPWLPKLID